MQDKTIYLCLAHMGGQEQKYIQEAFDTNWVVPLGPNVNAFEDALARFEGEGKSVVALSAGTAAVHLGLILLGVKAGDEVVCQSFTFSASANPIVYQGATPVFVDSEESTLNMSPLLLDEAIRDRMAVTGRKPKAIVVVHLYGMPARWDEIAAVAAKYEIPILEDSAEALGSQYDGRRCGTLGHLGVLSFNGNKMITTSGGGALVCSTPQEKERAKFYATQSREPFPYYQHKEIGYNYRMSNICAGIGRGQMEVLEQHIAHHRHVHGMYVEMLKGVEGISVFSQPADKKFNSNYWLTTILVNPAITGYTYDDLRIYLQEHHVESRPLWKPMHLQPVFASAPRYIDGTAERMFNCGLCLPSGPCVTDEDLEYIVNLIKGFKQEKNSPLGKK